MMYEDEVGTVYYAGRIAHGRYMLYYKGEEDVLGHIYAGPYDTKERAMESLSDRAHAYGWRKAAQDAV